MIHMLGRKIKAVFRNMYPECTLYHENRIGHPYAKEYSLSGIFWLLKGIFHNTEKVNARSGDYLIQKAGIAFPVFLFILYYRQVGHQAEQGRVPAEEPEAASGNFLCKGLSWLYCRYI